jgi:hypothetical protein
MTKEIEEKDSGRWYIFDLYTPHNGKITVKESDPSQLFTNLEMLTAGLKEFIEKHPTFSMTPQSQSAPTNKIAMTDATGVPIVDAQTMEPVMVDLPSDTHVFTIKEVWRGQIPDTKKDNLHVTTLETYQYSGKFGLTCFEVNDPAFDGWKSWPVDAKYAPPKGITKVLVRDPKEGKKYATVLEFR